MERIVGGDWFVSKEVESRFIIETIIPESKFDPEHIRIVCRLPDGVGKLNESTANVLVLAKDMASAILNKCASCCEKSNCGSCFLHGVRERLEKAKN